MKKLVFTCSLLLLTLTFYAQQVKNESICKKVNEISVIYLGHSGWAIKSGNNFLIFDYQEKYDFNWDKQPEKNLLSGYINPDEIKDLNVYVFISHSHSDHYDPVILDWEKEIENIKYFFGWDFSKENKYNCLKDPRSQYKDDIVEVYTVNSHHSGVFESAFLVKIDGISIYHNGDYKGDYINDYNYLKTKADKIDIIFSNSVPIEDTQYFKQSILLMKQFGVKYFFPMHSINKEHKFKLLAEMIEKQDVTTMVHCAEIKGDKFKLEIN